MFANACQKMSQITKPVIVSYRLYNGEVNNLIGTFFIINQDGWFLTCAHILEPFLQQETQLREKTEKDVPVEPSWLEYVGSRWGAEKHLRVGNIKFFGLADLGIGRIENFDPTSVSQYPTFKNPRNIQVGKNLCKVGFAFPRIKVSFEETTKQFNIDRGDLNFFPLDGIYTRNIVTEKMDGKIPIKFLEMSSPGLKGQSGGPVFDSDGLIWSVLSKNVSLDLGFTATAVRGNEQIQEHQFLNVSWGIHPETLMQMLDREGISYKVSDYGDKGKRDDAART